VLPIIRASPSSFQFADTNVNCACHFWFSHSVFMLQCNVLVCVCELFISCVATLHIPLHVLSRDEYKPRHAVNTAVTRCSDVFEWSAEDGGRIVLRNFGILPQHYVTSQPRTLRLEYEFLTDCTFFWRNKMLLYTTDSSTGLLLRIHCDVLKPWITSRLMNV
jgi:hypothetical protein